MTAEARSKKVYRNQVTFSSAEENLFRNIKKKVAVMTQSSVTFGLSSTLFFHGLKRVDIDTLTSAQTCKIWSCNGSPPLGYPESTHF
jgi:hypothetical protein